jgi:hypothetical protein
MRNHRFFHETWRQWAAIVVLGLLGLGIVRVESSYDLPHLHSQSGPTTPTTNVLIYASGNTTSTMLTYDSLAPYGVRQGGGNEIFR